MIYIYIYTCHVRYYYSIYYSPTIVYEYDSILHYIYVGMCYLLCLIIE